jgi:integrase/recombinase XerD
LAHNPAKDLEGPKAARPLPQVLSQDDAELLVEAPPDDSPRGRRDRAALELLYGSGLRASEVCGLRLDDINLASGLVRPRGKGKHERLVPLGELSRVALQSYLDAGRSELLRGAPSDFVFIGNLARPLSRMGLFKIVRRYGLVAGVNRPLSPHALRHAFASHLLRGGADLRAVQEMLGHVSISTTEIYTHVGQTQLQKTVDNHHPLGKGKND